jgi:hypothetical protein
VEWVRVVLPAVEWAKVVLPVVVVLPAAALRAAVRMEVRPNLYRLSMYGYACT